MATAMHRAGRTLLAEAALIVPVPLHRWRLWQRRFNQAAELGASLSRLSGVPHDPFVLERRRPTRRQVGLSAAQREENVRGSFRVPEPARAQIAAKPILLGRRRLHVRRHCKGGDPRAPARRGSVCGCAHFRSRHACELIVLHCRGKALYHCCCKDSDELPMPPVTIYTRQACGFCNRRQEAAARQRDLLRGGRHDRGARKTPTR
jgi:hypothetical protein